MRIFGNYWSHGRNEYIDRRTWSKCEHFDCMMMNAVHLVLIVFLILQVQQECSSATDEEESFFQENEKAVEHMM